MVSSHVIVGAFFPKREDDFGLHFIRTSFWDLLLKKRMVPSSMMKNPLVIFWTISLLLLLVDETLPFCNYNLSSFCANSMFFSFLKFYLYNEACLILLAFVGRRSFGMRFICI